MRRHAPRHIAGTVQDLTKKLTPPSLLARVQQNWIEVVGETIAAQAQPIKERDGVITVRCRSSVWASELVMMAPDLVARLNESLDNYTVSELRCVVGEPH